MEAIETFTHNGKTIEIIPDFDGSHANPRENCNLGKFYGEHRRYASPDDLDGDEVRRTIKSGAAIWLPVWMYDHSGTAYAAAESNPFHCPWDSGQFGVVYVTREDVRKEYGVKRISPQLKARVLDVLKAEVDEYGKWANGEVYGFRVLDEDGEEEDSCWGHIGLEWAIEAAKEAAS